jgi:hypothetical protein
MEDILAIDKRIKVQVELSTGGPADGFYITIDPEDRRIERIEYYFQDWWDGATRRLGGDEFDLVESMFGFVCEDLHG